MRMHSTKPSLWEVAEQTTMFVHQINCMEGNRMGFFFFGLRFEQTIKQTKQKQKSVTVEEI